MAYETLKASLVFKERVDANGISLVAIRTLWEDEDGRMDPVTIAAGADPEFAFTDSPTDAPTTWHDGSWSVIGDQYAEGGVEAVAHIEVGPAQGFEPVAGRDYCVWLSARTRIVLVGAVHFRREV